MINYHTYWINSDLDPFRNVKLQEPSKVQSHQPITWWMVKNFSKLTHIIFVVIFTNIQLALKFEPPTDLMRD